MSTEIALLDAHATYWEVIEHGESYHITTSGLNDTKPYTAKIMICCPNCGSENEPGRNLMQSDKMEGLEMEEPGTAPMIA
jgi:hypothetical protein